MAKAKYIAWLNHHSVAVGDSIEDVTRRALDIFNSSDYQRFLPKGKVELRITTYGSQRHIETRVLKNPRKKTVSEKISQLRREGTPQRQAVAIAMSEKRAGKVNPEIDPVCPNCGASGKSLKGTYGTVTYLPGMAGIKHGHFTCKKCKTSFGWSRDTGAINVKTGKKNPHKSHSRISAARTKKAARIEAKGRMLVSAGAKRGSAALMQKGMRLSKRGISSGEAGRMRGGTAVEGPVGRLPNADYFYVEMKDYLKPGGKYPYSQMARDMERAFRAGHTVVLRSVPGFWSVVGHQDPQGYNLGYVWRAHDLFYKSAQDAIDYKRGLTDNQLDRKFRAANKKDPERFTKKNPGLLSRLFKSRKHKAAKKAAQKKLSEVQRQIRVQKIVHRDYDTDPMYDDMPHLRRRGRAKARHKLQDLKAQEKQAAKELRAANPGWKVKTWKFKTIEGAQKARKQMELWLQRNQGRVQFNEIFVNNAYGIEYRPLRRINPSVTAIAEKFQGKADGSVEQLYAASSAPKNLARAGKLVFLKVNGRSMRIPGAMVAIAPNERLWITGDHVPLFQTKAKPGQQLDVGEVSHICYLTAKSHVSNGKTYEYVHEFGEDGGKRPHLIIDHEGMPILRGGDYKIKTEGIVN